MSETDPTPGQDQVDSNSAASTVVAQGEVPFAFLDDGRTIMACYRTTFTPRPAWSLSDSEATRWTLTLDGRRFTVLGPKDGEQGWAPIDDAWAGGDRAPLSALADGGRHVVRYDYFYAHHLGWLSGPVELAFDLDAMTITVSKDLKFEAD